VTDLLRRALDEAGLTGSGRG